MAQREGQLLPFHPSYWGQDVFVIRLHPEYHSGLMELEGFPCYYLFHLDQAEYTRGKHRWHHPRERKDMPSAGIFSQRNKDRPNNIGMTVVSVFSVDDAFLTVQGLDVINGTPLLDIKPYSPLYDKREAPLPEWIERLPEHSF